MKTTLILTLCLLLQTSFAQAKNYVLHVNQAQDILPTHGALNQLLQKDVMIDTKLKVMRVKLGGHCSPDGYCDEVLRTYPLKITSLGNKIVAEGLLPLQIDASTLGSALITIQKNINNAVTLDVTNSDGHSTFIGSPLEETHLLF